MAKKNENSANENIFLNDSIVKEIIDAVRGVDFGIITVKVHASRIVQMEVTQKKRFDEVWDLEGGGGI
ncbi:MAG: YezD family protein [Candidatus Omnitrophica bacterium]|nr:YezD family protein [Candidatus Omnitrophota bacterium]